MYFNKHKNWRFINMTEFNENQFNLNDLIEYKEHPEKYSDEEMQEFINWLMNYTLKYGFEGTNSDTNKSDLEKWIIYNDKDHHSYKELLKELPNKNKSLNLTYFKDLFEPKNKGKRKFKHFNPYFDPDKSYFFGPFQKEVRAFMNPKLMPSKKPIEILELGAPDKKMLVKTHKSQDWHFNIDKPVDKDIIDFTDVSPLAIFHNPSFKNGTKEHGKIIVSFAFNARAGRSNSRSESNNEKDTQHNYDHRGVNLLLEQTRNTTLRNFLLAFAKEEDNNDFHKKSLEIKKLSKEIDNIKKEKESNKIRKEKDLTKEELEKIKPFKEKRKTVSEEIKPIEKKLAAQIADAWDQVEYFVQLDLLVSREERTSKATDDSNNKDNFKDVIGRWNEYIQDYWIKKADYIIFAMGSDEIAPTFGSTLEDNDFKLKKYPSESTKYWQKTLLKVLRRREELQNKNDWMTSNECTLSEPLLALGWAGNRPLHGSSNKKGFGVGPILPFTAKLDENNTRKSPDGKAKFTDDELKDLIPEMSI